MCRLDGLTDWMRLLLEMVNAPTFLGKCAKNKASLSAYAHALSVDFRAGSDSKQLTMTSHRLEYSTI